ncbi:uncharacterized protein TNCV_1789631 [Trichonephila clavipes]|nr:uncharacterized protein TNCV_1789631 [Trichonephila clavipes]
MTETLIFWKTDVKYIISNTCSLHIILINSRVQLFPFESLIVPTIPCESQPPILNYNASTDNILHTLVPTLPSEDFILPSTSDRVENLSTEIQPPVPLLDTSPTTSSSQPSILKDVNKNSKRSRKRTKKLKPDIEIKMSPLKPKKSYVHCTSKDEDMIVYDVSIVPGFLPDDCHTASLVGLRGGWRNARIKFFFTLIDPMLLCPSKGLILPNLNIDDIAKQSRFLILSLPNTEMSRKSPFIIHIALIGLVGEPECIKKLRSGDLLLETTSALQIVNNLAGRKIIQGVPLVGHPYSRGMHAGFILIVVEHENESQFARLPCVVSRKEDGVLGDPLRSLSPRSSHMEEIDDLEIPLRSLWPTLHSRRVAGVILLLSIGRWYLSLVSRKRHCCRVSAADKGWWIYPLDPRPDAVVLYSGCTLGNRHARYLPDDRHTASLVGLCGGWRLARMKLCYALMDPMLLCPAKSFLDCPVSIVPQKSLNSCQGVISEPDLLTTTDAEILDGFSGQGVIQCQRFGDSQASCRGQLTCSRCPSAGHASTYYNLEPKCMNCSQPHPSDSKICPKWKIGKQIQEINTNKNISYPEVCKLIVPQLSQTYAQAAKFSTINNYTQPDENITKIKCPPLKLLQPLSSILKPNISASTPVVSTSSPST